MIRVGGLDPRDSDKINLEEEYDMGKQIKEAKLRIARIKKKKLQKDMKFQEKKILKRQKDRSRLTQSKNIRFKIYKEVI